MPTPPRLRRSLRRAAPAAAALLGLCAACGEEPAGAGRVTVFAAASLTEALTEVAAAWKAEGGADVRFSFGATSKLAAQVIDGAPADAVVAADAAWMDRLAEAGRIEEGSRRVVATNELVFVVPAGGAAPAAPGDLPGALRRIALAGENVPAGRYARAALEHAGAWVAVAPRVVRADDVRLALAWVAGGEADGGVVYRTDARAEPRVSPAFSFPPGSHPPVVYPGAVVRGAARAEDARRLLAFCITPRARAVFARHGFSPPSP